MTSDPEWHQQPFGQPPPPTQAEKLAEMQPSSASLGEFVSSLRDQPQASPGDYVVYTLPPSVMLSANWRGEDSDREFGLREPTTGELTSVFKSETQDDAQIVPKFIVEIGGQRVAHYTQAQAWWARISPTAQALVSQLLLETFLPTEDEGNALRASRRRPGQAPDRSPGSGHQGGG
jgi:hypothetical protein